MMSIAVDNIMNIPCYLCFKLNDVYFNKYNIMWWLLLFLSAISALINYVIKTLISYILYTLYIMLCHCLQDFTCLYEMKIVLAN